MAAIAMRVWTILALVTALMTGCSQPALNDPLPNTFYGVSLNGRNVIYCMDCNGSMIDEWRFIRQTLECSISLLKADQKFHIVIWGEAAGEGQRLSKPSEGPANGLVAATPANKREALTFIDRLRPCGFKDPVPALTRALDVMARAKRDGMGDAVLMLLTDGPSCRDRDMLELVKARGGEKSGITHTFLVVDRYPDAERVLRQVAQCGGGTYRFVAYDDLEPNTFLGMPVLVRQIVYCTDFNLSMGDTAGGIQDQVLDSISRLVPQQSFIVVAWGNGRPREGPGQGLIPATEGNKKAAIEFVNSLQPSTRTNALPAIEGAFDALDRAGKNRDGKLVFLVSNCALADYDSILTLLAARNTDRHVVIHTFLYCTHHPEAEQQLRHIATQTGGTYHFTAGQARTRSQ